MPTLQLSSAASPRHGRIFRYRIVQIRKNVSRQSNYSPLGWGCCRTCGEARQSPPSRRRGGRDLKKMLRSILCGADGVVVSSYRLFIANGFDNRWLETTTPSAPLRNGAISLGRSHPSFAKEGTAFSSSHALGNSPREGGEFACRNRFQWTGSCPRRSNLTPRDASDRN